MTRRRSAAVLAAAVLAGACGADGSAADRDAGTETDSATVGAGTAREFPPAPAEVPTGPSSAEVVEAVDTMLQFVDTGFGADVIEPVSRSGDPRQAWFLADLLRFFQGGPLGGPLTDAASTLTGADFDESRPWASLTDHLIAWDLPAPPEYREWKGRLFTTLDPRWEFVFADDDATIDYRILGWGGVPIDDRPLGDPERCPTGCIPALDDPGLVTGDEGDWYPDDGIVFGVEVDGEAVALPRNIMEIHEMVNITLGGRRLGIPYCTLCGSAQAFLTDEAVGVAAVERPLVLRTSGLLSRSNKVMYDLDTRSVFDTFTGEAVAGPLREAGVVLGQVSVVTTTWGEWRTEHPRSAIIAEDGGIGRRYESDPLRGRDDDGPIFPIGQVDDRLGVQEQVLGVVLDDGTPVAFPAAAARAVLADGGEVVAEGVSLALDGGGLVASVDGRQIPSHQAHWFAWSQFHPDTALWLPG